MESAMTEFTERRKADRIKMAAELEKLITECGASFVREDPPYSEGDGPISKAYAQCIRLNVTAARGLLVTVDLDGKSSQPDVHVLSWHIAHDSDARLADVFGDINRFHFCKASYVSEGFEALCDDLRDGLEMAADGTAFDAEREAACIAKDGTAAERSARFRLMRDRDAKREAIPIESVLIPLRAYIDDVRTHAPGWTGHAGKFYMSGYHDEPFSVQQQANPDATRTFTAFARAAYDAGATLFTELDV
jgi:hypothetical protein